MNWKGPLLDYDIEIHCYLTAKKCDPYNEYGLFLHAKNELARSMKAICEDWQFKAGFFILKNTLNQDKSG